MLKQYIEPDAGDDRQFSLESIQLQIERGAQKLEEFEAMTVAMEEAEQIIDDLETLIDSGDANQTTGVMMRERIEKLADSTGVDAPMPSMESCDGDMIAYHQISMEAVTGLWNRYKQFQVAQWQVIFDGFGTLFTGYARWGKRQQARCHRLRQEWNDKKSSLNEQRHKASMQGRVLQQAFSVDSRLSKDPVGDMTKDLEYTRYLNVTYLKELGLYLEKIRGVLTSGKYDTDEQFMTTLGKLTALPHPSSLLLKMPIVGKGNVLLANRGLEVWKGRAVRPVGMDPVYKKLSDLCVKTHVREFIYTWSMLNTYIPEDIYLTTKDVDTMLDMVEEYNGFLVNAVQNYAPMTRAFKNLSSFAKKTIDVEHLSNTNRKAFTQMTRFISGLARYSKTPHYHEKIRVQFVAIGARILTSRTIATAK